MAQNRRRERQRKREQRRQRLFAVIISAAALIVSLIVCLIMIGPMTGNQETGEIQSAMLPYDAEMPFSASDLTAAQLEQLRRDGRMRVSDGPRGISVGDPLDKVLACFPSAFTDKQDSSEQTGLQSDEEIILYCAEYFENQNGFMTALPPRGLLTVDSGSIVVTLLAPTSPYPAGTHDDYGRYEHLSCMFTIEPDSMTVSAITLGIDE